jgi:hypothetical protein
VNAEEREREAYAFGARTIHLLSKIITSDREVELVRLSLEYGYSQGLADQHWREVFTRLAGK